MCGRFSLKAAPDDLEKTLEAQLPAGYRPRYNIAPTQDVLAVVMEDGARRARMLRWGLVPFWADDPRIGNRMINARAETVAEKPAFRDSFRRHRCLIPADGFYEWQVAEGGKQPMRIRQASDEPFCFAGLAARWRRGEQIVESCTILTRAANAVLRPIHDRMPVIAPVGDYQEWLSPDVDGAALLARWEAASGIDLEAYPVSTAVNRPSHDLPDCIAPLVE
jgi:putative SOS response-associated peptidase YedK